MRQDIEINADGTALRGWLYVPDGGSAPFPCVIMSHGFSGVKEQTLDDFADVFAKAGLAVVLYDHRNLGASDGEPRQEIDPIQQARDYRHVITFAQLRDEIDSERIGLWGTSFSGGHVLMTAAIDRRVKCVVSQVPTISGSMNASRRVPPHMRAQVDANFNADRLARYQGEAPRTIPAVTDDPAGPAAMHGQDAFDFFTSTAKTRAPSWRNEVTVRSSEMGREYEPGGYVPLIGPTPLLMIVYLDDTLTPPDLQLAAYETALHPKKLVTRPGGHFAPYIDDFEAASSAARDWFLEHLS